MYDVCTCSQQTILQPHERAQLAVSNTDNIILSTHSFNFQLEACYLESQNKASKLQKELLHVREQLQSREREIQELNKELATVKEELMIRYL